MFWLWASSPAGFGLLASFPTGEVLKQVQDDESDSDLLLLRTSCKDSFNNDAICG